MTRVSSVLFGLIAAAFSAGISANANAATCPGTQGTTPGSMLFTLVTSPVSSCADYANGTLGSNPDPFIALHPGFTLLDNTANNDGPANGALTMVGGSAGTGTFLINSTLTSGYTSLVLAFEDGQGPTQSPQWGAFLLGALTGSWSIQELVEDTVCTGSGKDKKCVDELVNKFKGLSHAVLYGILGQHEPPPPPNPVPLPPALLLFGTGLVGLTVLRRRRRNA